MTARAIEEVEVHTDDQEIIPRICDEAEVEERFETYPSGRSGSDCRAGLADRFRERHQT